MVDIIKKETSVVMIDGKATEITISDDRAKQLYKELVDNSLKGMELYFENCEKVIELRDSNGYYALGFDSFKAMAEELFETGETQAKNMCLVCTNYGVKSDDGFYHLVDKDYLKTFTATQLIEIKGLKGFEKGKLAETMEKYGMTQAITCAQIRALKQAEKNHDKMLTLAQFAELKQAIETSKPDDSKTDNSKADDSKADNSKTDNSKVDVKKLESENSSLKADNDRLNRVQKVQMDFIGELQVLCLTDTGKKLSDKDFRKKVTDLVLNMGKDNKKNK